MPRPCEQRHPVATDFAKQGVPWDKSQCAVCWGFLNNPGLRKLYENSKPTIIRQNDKPKYQGCCGKGVASKAKSAINSFASWTGEGFRKPTAEQLAEREKICFSNVCGKHDPIKDQCKECGCFLKTSLPLVGDVGKRNHANESCPVRLWTAV